MRKKNSFEARQNKNLLDVVRAANVARDTPWYTSTTLRFRNGIHEADFLAQRHPPTLLWIITPLFVWSAVQSFLKETETRDFLLLAIGMSLSVTMIILEVGCQCLIHRYHHELWVTIFVFFTLAFFTNSWNLQKLFELHNCMVVIIWQFYFAAVSNVSFVYAAPCYLCICTAYLCLGYFSTTFNTQREEVGVLYAYTHTPAAMVYCYLVVTVFHYQVRVVLWIQMQHTPH
jgi:hypothetical protein